MPFTLSEYKKMTQDPLKAAVIQTYLDNAPFLEYLKMENIVGGSLSYNVEESLPDAGFRAIGAKYTASEGSVKQENVVLKVAGGKIEIDRALRKMYGDDRLSTSINMKTKALARVLNKAFYKGDGTGGSFTGLQSRVATASTIVNGDAPLKLSALREAIVKCQGSNKVAFMSTEMYLLLSDAKNSATLGGQINIVQDEFGNPVTYFAGVPVVRAGQDTAGAEILDFGEANTTSSIYVLAFSEDGVIGIQNGEIETYMPVQDSAKSEFDIEWLMNYAIQDPKSAWRISGITNAAIVA